MSDHTRSQPNSPQHTGGIVADASDKQLRKIRHDMLNTIGVMKLELHVLKRHADEKGVEMVTSTQEQVEQLQKQLDDLCDEARAMARRATGEANN